MSKIDVIDRIQKSSDLLSLPQAISELLTEMEKPDFSPGMLSTIILKDPGLTGKILKMANSSFYQRFGAIRTVKQAVNVLGLTTVKMMALSSSVLNPERLKKNTGLDPKAFFSNVLTAAAAAEKIARAIEYKAPEEAFIGGLLHDIGIILFLHHYPEEYRKVINKEIKVRTLIDAEREIFNTDHAEIGYHLALKWHLPENLAEAIRDHHNYYTPIQDNTLTNIILLATLITEGDSLSYSIELEERLRYVSKIARMIGLSKDKMDEISTSVMSEIVSIAEFMGIDIGDINDMLIRANKEIWKTYLVVENLFQQRQEMSAKLLHEERAKGAVESKNIAIATLSHYVNNATMAIYGRTQLISKFLAEGQNERLIGMLKDSIIIMEKSILKISAVLAEIKEISPIDDIEFYEMSQAMKVDDRIEKRMQQMLEEPINESMKIS